MQFHALIAPARLTLAALCTGGMLLSSGCRSDELQGPVQAPEGIRMPSMAVVPTNGLVGEWKLDETSGTAAVDSKNGFNATVFGGAAFVPGKIGNGLNLNNGTAGTGGKYAEMPSNATLNDVQEGDYTISAWFYPFSVPPNATTDNPHWGIVLKAGFHMGLVYQFDQKFSMRHYLTGPVLKTANSATTYPLNTWHHVVGVVSKAAGTVTLYVNGASVGSGTFEAGAVARDYGTTRFRIGKAFSWAADGKVDQVRIYSRALSAAEVGDLFHESGAGVGLPFGPQDLYDGWTDPKANTSVFTASKDYTAPNAGWISRVDSARARGKKLLLTMTGDCHSSDGNGNPNCDPNGPGGVDGPYRTNGKFDLTKWKNEMNRYNTTELKAVVDSGVADGTILGNSVMDEPTHSSWLGGDPNWLTKNTIDQMCAHVKGIFPTLPVGVAVVSRWRRNEHYAVCDFIIDQFEYDVPGNTTPAAYRDSALALAQDDDVQIVFSLNILDGGKRVAGCTPGTFGANCQMTAADMQAAGLTLGPAGSGLFMWRYDFNYMNSGANQAAFDVIADDLNSRPAKSWLRP
jgi:hypothetical protein